MCVMMQLLLASNLSFIEMLASLAHRVNMLVTEVKSCHGTHACSTNTQHVEK